MVLSEAVELLGRLTQERGLPGWIGGLEASLVGMSGNHATADVIGLDQSTLEAALLLKRAAGQINVIVHAVGILTSLPYILEPDEVLESLSLGAGNTGRKHDLETDRRVAEFKFIEWRGGAEAIRRNGVFSDLVNLVTSPTQKRRVLYLVGTDIPLRFFEGGRSLASVMSRDAGLARRFRETYGDRYLTVREYFEAVRGSVEIVDLASVVPGLAGPGTSPSASGAAR